MDKVEINNMRDTDAYRMLIRAEKSYDSILTLSMRNFLTRRQMQVARRKIDRTVKRRRSLYDE